MNRGQILIGITGGSGSGKTSFIQALKSHFALEMVCVISQDDYYFPREEQLEDGHGFRNFDRPRSIDKKAFLQDILRLRNGETVHRTEYTFNNAEAVARTLEFKPARVIIVEGLFVLHFKKIARLLDLKVFLHAKDNLKVIRRIKRDRIERNYPLDDVLYRYEHHVLPTFERYIQPYIGECDIIVNNNTRFDMGLNVIKGFIENWILQDHKSGSPDGALENHLPVSNDILGG